MTPTTTTTTITTPPPPPPHQGLRSSLRSVFSKSGSKPAATLSAEPEYASSCYLPTEWTELPLLSKSEYNHDSTIYEFELPRCTSLNLPACGCILLNAPGAEKDGSDPGKLQPVKIINLKRLWWLHSPNCLKH